MLGTIDSEIDNLIETYGKPKRERSAAPLYAIDLSGFPDDEKMARGRAYLAKLPVAVEGLKGSEDWFRAVCAVLIGFDLNEHDGRELLEEFSERCEPPWSEDEIDHAIERALRLRDEKPHERGYLLRASLGIDHPEGRTDVAMALRFVDENLNNLRFVPEWKRFIVRNEARWVDDVSGAFALRLLKESARRLWREVARLAPDRERPRVNEMTAFAKYCSSDKGMRSSLNVAKADERIWVSPAS